MSASGGGVEACVGSSRERTWSTFIFFTVSRHTEVTDQITEIRSVIKRAFEYFSLFFPVQTVVPSAHGLLDCVQPTRMRSLCTHCRILVFVYVRIIKQGREKNQAA